MASNKDQVQAHTGLLGKSGLSGQSLTGFDVFIHGVVAVVQLMTSTSTVFIKMKQGMVEVGGDQNWGTGTQVL